MEKLLLSGLVSKAHQTYFYYLHNDKNVLFNKTVLHVPIQVAFSFLYTQSYKFLRFIACKFKMKTKPDMLKTIIFLLQLSFEESTVRFSSYFDTLYTWVFLNMSTI